MSWVPPHIGRLPLRSETCSSHHFRLDAYAYWCARIAEVPRHHRKQWEFFYICQALWERGFLGEGFRGLGFGVGREPLTALFASAGCSVLATDLDEELARNQGWAGDEHAASGQLLNERGICPQEVFARRVNYRNINMSQIPEDLIDFDFCWSACALEHLGDLEAGLHFVERSLACLRPGGLAVHTTEFNLDSNEGTLERGATVVYRRRDIEELMGRLAAKGHRCEPLMIHRGSEDIDEHIDVPPYSTDQHLRLRLAEHNVTSIGLITMNRSTH
jgi:SAM-dependent methyltransferase